MLHKTKGIVLRTTAFKESSVIAKIYTQKFGVQSYMINGVRSEKKTAKAGLFSILTILDLVVYKHEHKKLERISEVKPHYVSSSSQFDMYKSSMLFFIAELLNKTLHEDETNEELYDWIESQIIFVNENDEMNASQHLNFMLQLSKHLGFFPQTESSESSVCFDLMNGVMTNEIPAHLHYIRQPEMSLFSAFVNDDKAAINRIQRKKLLQILTEYFQLHVPGFSPLKSPEVLESVFD